MKKADKMTWAGRVISVLVTLPFIMSAAMKLSGKPEVVEGMAHLGLPQNILMLLSALEILCIVVYLIPATSVLGAILFTGYVGGTIITHLRVGEPVYLQATFGVLIWLGLYLREKRLHALLPLRRDR